MSDNDSPDQSNLDMEGSPLPMNTLDPNLFLESCRLTRYADPSGREYKDPKDVAEKLVASLLQYPIQVQEAEYLWKRLPQIGIDLDCSIIPLRYDGMTGSQLKMVQTADFLYPIVDDPYMMGRIACANVLSGVYARGVTKIDNMLLLLAVSTKMSEQERDVVVPTIIRGFKDLARDLVIPVTGGQSIVNPWCAIGGMATTVCDQDEFIAPNNAVVGDVLVLTKPLGTQVAIYAHQWLDQSEHLNWINCVVSEEDVNKAYRQAMDSMSRLNRVAAELMHTYNAHAATDITGFGLLDRAQKLASQQKNEVSFVINNLPVIGKMAALANACGDTFPLLQGHSVETSGGLLICLPREQAEAYCQDFEQQEGYRAWTIGFVENGNRTARVFDNPLVIEVPANE